MPTSNVSATSLVNRSLLSLGQAQLISSVFPSDGSAAANAANLLFIPVFEQLARSARWGCLKKQATLSLISAAQGTPENPNGTPPFPPQPWCYSYAEPSDCLFMRALAPVWPGQSSGTPDTTINNAAPVWLPGMEAVPYQMAYATDANNNPINVILTNQSQAQAIYTVNQPNPVVWDSLFQQAFVSTLGAFLVPALSLHLPLLNMLIKSAEGMIARARAMDGNENPVSQDVVPDWIRARQGGSGVGPSWGGTAYGGFQDISWPAFAEA